MEVDPVFRILIVGSSNVGKSSIVTRYKSGKFNHGEQVTVGVNASTQTIEYGDSVRFILQIWDMAGGKDFEASIQPYMENAQIVLFVFALNDNMSFESIPGWIKRVDETHVRHWILVGNKADLTKSEKVVTDDDIARLKHAYDMIYYETSALSGHNITELFQNILYTLSTKLTVECDDFNHDESIELLDEEENGVILPRIKKKCCVVL